MAEWLVNCLVTRTGPPLDGDRTLIALSDRNGAFADRWFNAAPAVRAQVRATALTAMSIGGRVEALVDDGAAEYSTLYTLQVALPG
jgi:hypothetical protein